MQTLLLVKNMETEITAAEAVPADVKLQLGLQQVPLPGFSLKNLE